MGYDRFPEALIDEKKLILKRACEENWILFFTHDPDMAACSIQLGDRGKYEIKETYESLDDFAI